MDRFLHRIFHKIYTPLVFLLIAVIYSLASFPAQASLTQDQIKVAMIRKFAEFVKWPDDVSPRNSMNVKVCAYANTPIALAAAVLEKTVPNQAVHYSFVPLAANEPIGKKCHVIFISNQEQERLPALLASLSSQPVLTISDISNFVNRGGMIGFVVVDGKIKYDINNQAFGLARLKVDAQLLETANKVVE